MGELPECRGCCSQTPFSVDGSGGLRDQEAAPGPALQRRLVVPCPGWALHLLRGACHCGRCGSERLSFPCTPASHQRGPTTRPQTSQFPDLLLLRFPSVWTSWQASMGCWETQAPCTSGACFSLGVTGLCLRRHAVGAVAGFLGSLPCCPLQSPPVTWGRPETTAGAPSCPLPAQSYPLPSTGLDPSVTHASLLGPQHWWIKVFFAFLWSMGGGGTAGKMAAPPCL